MQLMDLNKNTSCFQLFRIAKNIDFHLLFTVRYFVSFAFICKQIFDNCVFLAFYSGMSPFI
jgi:hypothetical protein